MDGGALRQPRPAPALPTRPGLRRAQHRLHARRRRHRPARRASLRRVARRRLRAPAASRPLPDSARRRLRPAPGPHRRGRAHEPRVDRHRVQPRHHRVLRPLGGGGPARPAQRGAGLRRAGHHGRGRRRARDPRLAVPERLARGNPSARAAGAGRHRRRRRGAAERRVLLDDVERVPAAGARPPLLAPDELQARGSAARAPQLLRPGAEHRVLGVPPALGDRPRSQQPRRPLRRLPGRRGGQPAGRGTPRRPLRPARGPRPGHDRGRGDAGRHDGRGGPAGVLRARDRLRHAVRRGLSWCSPLSPARRLRPRAAGPR